jgi:NADH/NAD ratio-sensing transcriptional regulator Rex
VTAHSFPLAAHRKHYLGFGQFGERQFGERKHLMDQIEDKLKQQSKPISLVGIGGIG